MASGSILHVVCVCINRIGTARCSPDTELRALHEKIVKRHPQGKPTFRITNPPSFDSGIEYESVRWAMDISSDRLAPAINLLMASEITGHALEGESSMSAMRWLRDEYSGLWVAFALRFGGIGISLDPDPTAETKADSIRRTTLEQLPTKHVERVFSATFEELKRHIESAEMGQDRREWAGGGVLTSTARLTDIVTRLSMCLEDNIREQLVEVLFRVARIPFFRRHPGEIDTIRHLAERSIPYLNDEQLTQLSYQILLEFPLNSTEDDKWHRSLQITDSMRLLSASAVNLERSDEIGIGIQVLIDALSTSDLKRRTDAALRLLRLFESKALTEEEREHYRKGIWDIVDDCGLPRIDDERITKHVNLLWPAHTKDRSIDGLRTWIISANVEDRFITSDAEDGQSGGQVRLSWPDQGKYLPQLLDLAKRLDDDPEMYGRIFDEKTRAHIGLSIFAWWARERDLFNRETKLSLFTTGDIFSRLDMALRAIFECTLSADGLEEGFAEKVGAFLDDVQQFHNPSPYRYPIMASLYRDTQDEAWNGIRGELWNADPNVSHKALMTVWQWQRGVKRLKLIRMPENVFGVLVSAIANLDSAIGYHGYSVLCDLIEKGFIKPQEYDLSEVSGAVESVVGKMRYGSKIGVGGNRKFD